MEFSLDCKMLPLEIRGLLQGHNCAGSAKMTPQGVVLTLTIRDIPGAKFAGVVYGPDGKPPYLFFFDGQSQLVKTVKGLTFQQAVETAKAGLAEAA